MAKKRASGEGSLFQRKTGRHKGKWVARITVKDEHGRPKRIDYLFDSQAEAKAKLREAIQDVAKGRQPLTKGKSLDAYLVEWMDRRVKPKVSANTRDRYASAIKAHIKPDAISTMLLSQIRITQVNDLFARRTKAGAAPATLRNIRAVLSAAFQQAVKEELIYDNPVSKSDPPRQAEKSLKYLNPEEAKKLIKKAENHELKALIVTAIYTGMRLSELIGLAWDRVDLTNGTITVNQQLQRHEHRFYLAPLKTAGGKRTIPMADAVREQLKAQKGASVLADAPPSEVPNLIFVSRSGQPYHRKTVLERINSLMKEAEVPEIGFHALRHTCASILINRGADALQVQRQLGHSSVRMTLDTYSHLFEERLQDNVSLIDQALA